MRGRFAIALFAMTVSCGGGDRLGMNERSPDGAPPERVVELAAGAEHTCARYADGRVACWGGNQFGELGRSDEGGAKASIGWAPALVNGLDDIVQISAAGGVTCARRATGTIRCWGVARKGRSFSANVDMPGLNAAIDVAVGFADVCAITRTRDVVCKSLLDDAPARRIEGASPAERVAVGHRHACVLVRGGDVRCWGDNAYGELASEASSHSDTPLPVAGLMHAVQVKASLRHTCAWEDDGTVWCWGQFQGIGIAHEPFGLPLVEGLVGLAATERKACGWFLDGSVECIERGKGKLPDRRSVDELGGVIELVAGFRHFCSLDRKGRVFCWGSNDRGQLGDARAASVAPRRVSGIDDAKDLVASTSYACALRASGALVCWGDLPFLQRDKSAVAAGISRTLPALVASNVARVASTSADLCLVGDDASVRCSGAPSRAPFERAAALGDSRELAMGKGFVCALGADGRVRCLGDNEVGQLGDGTTESRGEPVSVLGLSEAQQIATASGQVCALVRGGGVHCWGAMGRVQLPPSEQSHVDIGTFVDLSPSRDDAYAIDSWLVEPDNVVMAMNTAKSPREVHGLSNIVRLAAAGGDVCALDGTGRAFCWSPAEGVSPKPAFDMGEVTGVAGSEHHGCALFRDGRVACSGENARGELGSGEFSGPRKRASFVLGIDRADQIAAGDYFSCARRSGEVWCWGSDLRGELGDGRDLRERGRPTRVEGLP